VAAGRGEVGVGGLGSPALVPRQQQPHHLLYALRSALRHAGYGYS
jgi:hypothetical protein